MKDLPRLLVGPKTSLREVMARIDEGHVGVALVVDAEQHLLATVTDGDLRRAILAGLDLSREVGDLLKGKTGRPITAPAGTTETELVAVMQRHKVRHIPMVDESGRVVDLSVLDEIVQDYTLPLTAVVMAGGFGTRLRPLTDDVPKPMLPIGDQPLLGRLIGNLRRAGVREVRLATHYKPEVIERHFGDGDGFGVNIRYVQEDDPLGTAGALRMLAGSHQPLLIMNGDILTGVDVRAMLDFHVEHGAAMTLGTCEHEVQVPYGVVESRDGFVTGIKEKPVIRSFINAGIYLIDPDVCDLVPAARRYDMPDLIRQLVTSGRRVACFPIREYWRDIGQVNDYRQAVADAATGKV